MLGLKEGGGRDEDGGSRSKRLVCMRLAIIIVLPIPTAMEETSVGRTRDQISVLTLWQEEPK